MVARGVVAAAALVFGAWAVADEPKKADALKKEVVGKWESADKDRAPVEFRADGTITVHFYPKDGKWMTAEGTWTINDAGKITYKAASGGASLGGWYEYKDGELVTAMGPKNRVSFKRVEQKK